MSAIRFEDASGRVVAFHTDAAHPAKTGVVRRVARLLREWRQRATGRAELAGLDDRMLADIGITRADAEFLANRPFWKE